MGDAAATADVRNRVKEILRRDLKLGPDIRIDDDMPLFNSDADLDSLDMLLLVSSIEREFAFRIPNESVGEKVFQSVDSLTKFIEANRHSLPANSKVASVILDPLSQLPHADPFRFVSKLTSVKAGESAEGVWIVTGTEAFFAGHFPGNPLVPGVLIAEALAQLSGLISPMGKGGKLAQVDVRFDRAIAPPAEIILKSRLIRQVGLLQQFDVSAEIGGESVARGNLALHRDEGAT